MSVDADVLIIGAGPSGAIAAKLLRQKKYTVLVLERAKFPRFSIGESMLPQTMQILQQADMLKDVEAMGFQYKDGAAFALGNKHSVFDFTDKFSEGPGTTFQVERGTFDKVLADNAESAGAEIHYQEEILDIDFSAEYPQVRAKNLLTDEVTTYRSSFVLDASGFGRVLPRLLDLETPSNFPSRQSLFTHIEDNISDENYDRNKIIIEVHPNNCDVWYWLIPFANGRCSLGVVAEESWFTNYSGDKESMLRELVNEAPNLKRLLHNARFDSMVNQITGYSANVKQLWGKNFCLLGNAGEFLDPIFSSGVTIAAKSAALAVDCVDRHLQGQAVDFDSEYAEVLQAGVNTFRDYVESWYNGDFQNIIFNVNDSPSKVKAMICSILCGYAWDKENPYVAQSRRRLNVLAEYFRPKEDTQEQE